jgi:hypothetical protein
MIEKRWKAVPSQLFIADGTTDGKILIASSACHLFKVKQQVVLKSSTIPSHDTLEIKRIIDGAIYVGLKSENIDSRYNLSAYLVADGASIEAIEQKRSSVPFEEFTRAEYEEEPVVAKRVILVDECGDKYTEDNRLPVNATVNVTAGSKPGTHTIFNKLVTAANTEVFVLLPPNTEKITIMARSNKAVRIQYTFTSGESGTKFITITPGVRKEINDIGLIGATPLYFQLSLTEVGGTIVEIETWNI